MSSRQDDRTESNSTFSATAGSIIHPNAHKIFPEALQPFRGGILAYGSSILSTIVGFPLDTIKTRMQTYSHFKGYTDCVKKTYALEGTRGFFRGIWAPLISTSFSKSFNISVFTAVKPYVASAIYSNRSHRADRESSQFLANIPVSFLSGALAGGCVTLFSCPFEFIKIYAQLSTLVQLRISKPPGTLSAIGNESTIAIARHIVRNTGFGGLYSGFKYQITRDTLSTGIYYSVYESAKWIMNRLFASDPSKGSHWLVLMAGGVSGVLCWTLVFPLDTAKSLYQKNVVRSILRKEQGAAPETNQPAQKVGSMLSKRLYRGLGISIARTFLVNMVFFGAYEQSMAYLV